VICVDLRTCNYTILTVCDFYKGDGECLLTIRPESSGTIRVSLSLQRVDIKFYAALSGVSYDYTKLIFIHLSRIYATSDKIIFCRM
jgi:hypothetical protein